MTWDETKELIKMMRNTYIKYFQNFTDNEYKSMTDAWTLYLKDFTFEQSVAGLVDWSTRKSNGFPPDPAQLIKCIRGIMNPAINQMSGLEVWAMVREAIRDSTYNAVERFNELPKLAQMTIGHPAVLKEWGQQPSDVVTDHVQSRFLKAYAEAEEKASDYENMHSSVKALVDNILEGKNEKVHSLPGGRPGSDKEEGQRSIKALRG